MRVLLLLCVLYTSLPARAGPDLLLEVRLEQHLLADAIGAWQQDGQVYLPLGELARLLTIAIRSDARAGQASGYLLDPQRGFLLDLDQQLLLRGDQRERVPADAVLRKDDDLYVASGVLAAWLPVDLELDLASLRLTVRPRQRLPLQARFERQARSLHAPSSGDSDPGYPGVATAYRLADLPFIDQTLALQGQRMHGRSRSSAHYTAYLTGDLLGSEAALYVNTGARARLTMGRHDPDAGLLGPLRATTVLAGSVAAPAVQHIAMGSGSGNGIALTNHPLGQANGLDRHSLQGDLAPGWDVELYYNEALIAFQQARADGKYAFDDLPLHYGPNQFRLVFHGPLGQLRVERHSFLLEQAPLAPGQWRYKISAQHDSLGCARAVAQFDFGLARQLAAAGGVVRLGQQRFANLGLRGYWNNVIASASAVRSDKGGSLAQAALQTRLGPVALSASRARTRDFVSDYYPAGRAVSLRDELRADGLLPLGERLMLPFALNARRDRLADGASNWELAARLSAYRFGTALSHSLRWQSLDGARQADASVQLSRRMAGFGVSAHAGYRIAPRTGLADLALALDKQIGVGYLLNLNAERSLTEKRNRYSVALNKHLGRYGLGLNAHYTPHGALGAGVQLFVALGREPRSARWIADAAPMAGMGAASVQVYLDRNRNGAMDAGEQPVAGAGFLTNGGAGLARTDASGITWLPRLASAQPLDIAIDASTLEDPQWEARSGMRVYARPGRVMALEFAIGVTGEIDGTTYLADGGKRRAMGDVELELVDAREQVAGRIRSSADGYYIMARVAPGSYRLRVAPAQLARLGLRAEREHLVVIDPDGSFVNARDFVIAPVAAR